MAAMAAVQQPAVYSGSRGNGPVMVFQRLLQRPRPFMCLMARLLPDGKAGVMHLPCTCIAADYMSSDAMHGFAVAHS
jgi:hypothetical protein